MNVDTIDCTGDCCCEEVGLGCVSICPHENLEYNLCCDTVTCSLCGKKWRADSEVRQAYYEFVSYPPYFSQ